MRLGHSTSEWRQVFLQKGLKGIIVTHPFTVLAALGTPVAGVPLRVHTELVPAIFFTDFAGNDIVSATVLGTFTTICDSDDISCQRVEDYNKQARTYASGTLSRVSSRRADKSLVILECGMHSNLLRSSLVLL